MSYALVVVDMQYSFENSMNATLENNCIREILKAVKDNAPIIFLEYDGMDDTLESLTECVKNYKNYYIEVKYDDDGSEEVEQIVLNNKLPKRKFKVCGVNTDCCVADTVFGLTEKFPTAKVEVIEDACNSSWSHENGIARLSNYNKNVKVLHKE
jgi:nicotinamidase-related amidase